MSRLRRLAPIAALWAAAVWPQAYAQDEVNPSTLYEISTEGTSTKVKSGEKGLFVLSIKSKPGAHVSDEAPLKLQLKGTQLVPSKEQLAFSDSVSKKEAGQPFADPRFEVPFILEAGEGTLDAKLTFFICTEKICARQQKTFSIPVEAL
ncbi:hypothetical protein POL68_07795 [Stigmatella sp. ncwal1]|uniref:Thiol:disulfide interchange protein DsbD N-terminal domain-containing protein n=1 Tax=Stigmatella ashevillensis TaxID=2995309 RepID=A0ABT5D466_9BACT|nr:hypothetical protein [Stigmatella ashevillena]MDC0708366.1 hypothetical protein [Stigmatella ashevillena]